MSINAASRKLFNYDNLSESKVIQSMLDSSQMYENSISACGCLFYRKETSEELQLLLIKYDDPEWPRLDDFGGKIDSTDNTVVDAIIRETSEETNEIISSNILTALINNDSTKTFYNKKSKYLVKLIKVDSTSTFCNNSDMFGNIELHDSISRTIRWYNYNDVKDILAFRLCNNDSLMQYLNSL